MFAKKPLLSKFHKKWKGICCVFYCHFQLPCIVLSESGQSLTGHHSCRRPGAAGQPSGHHRIQLSETRGSWVALQIIVEYSCQSQMHQSNPTDHRRIQLSFGDQGQLGTLQVIIEYSCRRPEAAGQPYRSSSNIVVGDQRQPELERSS